MSTSSNHSLYPHPAVDAFADGFAGGILGGVTYLLFHSYFHLGGFEYSGWTLLALALTLGLSVLSNRGGCLKTEVFGM